MQLLTCRTRNVFSMNKKRKALNNNDHHSLQIHDNYQFCLELTSKANIFSHFLGKWILFSKSNKETFL